MELKITTTYSNIDEMWLEWYLKRLANEEVMPGSTIIAEELAECGHAAFKSHDPSSRASAITVYEVIK